MTDEEATQLGTFIRTQRLDAKIGLRELAKQSGVSPANLLKIETGKIKEPSPHSLQRIARALGCIYEDLAMLAGYTLPDGLPTLPVYLRTKYDELSDEEIRDVERYVRFMRQERGADVGDDDGQPSR